jgi:hypothetical protein
LGLAAACVTSSPTCRAAELQESPSVQFLHNRDIDCLYEMVGPPYFLHNLVMKLEIRTYLVCNRGIYLGTIEVVNVYTTTRSH